MDKKYSSIIPKLGFKHQLCIFHTKKTLNKQLKNFKDKNLLSDEEYQEGHKQLKMIKDLFDLNDFDEFKNELKSLIYRKDDFYPFIYKIIRKFIFQDIKTSFITWKIRKLKRLVTKLKMLSKKQCQNQENDHSRPNEVY